MLSASGEESCPPDRQDGGDTSTAASLAEACASLATRLDKDVEQILRNSVRAQSNTDSNTDNLMENVLYLADKKAGWRHYNEQFIMNS